MIPRIELGSGYSIPRVVLGGWQHSTGHSEAGIEESDLFALWDRFQDAGADTFDCADIYTGVESLIGRYLNSRRRRGLSIPQVHTKFVPDRSALPTLDRRYVERIIDRSLLRLGLDRLDLVQLHWWDYEVGGCQDALGWLDDLRRDGKIRLLGLTNFDTRRLGELLATGLPIASLQLQYSVIDQRPARQLVRRAVANDVALLCYGTLAGGFLSPAWLGVPAPTVPANRSLVKYRLVIDESGGWDWYQGVLEALDRVGRRHDAALDTVALRWVLDREGVAAAIVGARRERHLVALDAAVRLDLTPEDQATIAAAAGADPGPPGDVYSAERDSSGPHAGIIRYDLNVSPD